MARRRGDEIVSYAEEHDRLYVLTPAGRCEDAVGQDCVAALHRHFGLSEALLRAHFAAGTRRRGPAIRGKGGGLGGGVEPTENGAGPPSPGREPGSGRAADARPGRDGRLPARWRREPRRAGRRGGRFVRGPRRRRDPVLDGAPPRRFRDPRRRAARRIRARRRPSSSGSEQHRHPPVVAALVDELERRVPRREEKILAALAHALEVQTGERHGTDVAAWRRRRAGAPK